MVKMSNAKCEGSMTASLDMMDLPHRQQTIGLRSELRLHTRSLHMQAEASLEKLQPFRSAGTYTAYLQAHYQARQPLEHLLRGTVEQSWVLQSFLTSGALKDDLAYFGITPFEQTSRASSHVGHAFRWGIAYVLAGSSMGANILRKRAAALHLTASTGARHLALQADAARNWPAFVTALDQAETESSDSDFRENCLDGAEHAFATMIAGFEGKG